MSWLSQTADAEPALDVASPVSRAVHGIWEADELFRCPLVGMGITLAEQKHLLKKMSLPAVELTPFEIHELFVNAAATENPLSRKMSQLLRRKYEREAAPLRLLSEVDFLAQWKLPSVVKISNVVRELRAIRIRLPAERVKKAKIMSQQLVFGYGSMSDQKNALASPDAVANLIHHIKIVSRDICDREF